jgi:hypothetical protein
MRKTVTLDISTPDRKANTPAARYAMAVSALFATDLHISSFVPNSAWNGTQPIRGRRLRGSNSGSIFLETNKSNLALNEATMLRSRGELVTMAVTIARFGKEISDAAT